MNEVVKNNISSGQAFRDVNSEFTRIKVREGNLNKKIAKLEQDIIKNNTSLNSSINNKLGDSFETVSKNLKTWEAEFNYDGDLLDTIVYTKSGFTITKTFNFTGEILDSIVLSGSTPNNISLTKSFSYDGDKVSNISYS